MSVHKQWSRQCPHCHVVTLTGGTGIQDGSQVNFAQLDPSIQENDVEDDCEDVSADEGSVSSNGSATGGNQRGIIGWMD